MLYTSPIDYHKTKLSSFLSTTPSQNLIVLHGMSEHRHRYEPFAKILSKQNINVFTLDLRGHGDSPVENTYGYLNGYMKQVHDLYNIIQMIRKEHPLPTYLMGHSMGSLFVRSYLKHYQTAHIDGVLLMGSPYIPKGLSALRIGLKPLALLFPKKKGHVISKIMNKTFNKDIVNPSTPVDWLSFDKENVQTYIKDPLCNFPFTYSGYSDLFDLIHDVYQDNWTKVSNDTPIFFQIGAHDPCPDFKQDGFTNAIQKLNDDGYRNIKATIYDQSRHELLFDYDSKTVINDIIHFIKT